MHTITFEKEVLRHEILPFILGDLECRNHGRILIRSTKHRETMAAAIPGIVSIYN